MKKQSLALHFYKSVSLDLREEFQSVQSHNSTEKCGEYDEGAVWGTEYIWIIMSSPKSNEHVILDCGVSVCVCLSV